MVVKGQRGESCGADAPLLLLHLDGGGQTRCQGHLSLSLCPRTLTVGARPPGSGEPTPHGAALTVDSFYQTPR